MKGSSTALEGANANIGVAAACNHLPEMCTCAKVNCSSCKFMAKKVDVILHLDSLVWTRVATRITARAETLAPLVVQLVDILQRNSARLWIVYKSRDLGTIADDISKSMMDAVNKEMRDRGCEQLGDKNRIRVESMQEVRQAREIAMQADARAPAVEESEP